MRAVAQKLRDSPLTGAARTMEVAGDRIDTPLFSDGQEATEAWVGKEVVFIVGQATGHPSSDVQPPTDEPSWFPAVTNTTFLFTLIMFPFWLCHCPSYKSRVCSAEQSFPAFRQHHRLPPAFRIWHMANSNAPADAENTE